MLLSVMQIMTIYFFKRIILCLKLLSTIVLSYKNINDYTWFYKPNKENINFNHCQLIKKFVSIKYNNN